jgi:ADP-ribose pyrophosphatase YjhB (NUDIX family)
MFNGKENNFKMKIKVLVIGVVKKGNKILMRKKPNGSLPYKETWYLFGGELTSTKTPEQVIIDQVKNQAGIEVKVSERLSWDSEVKKDIDGEEKLFIYLDTLCSYVKGDLEVRDDNIEKLEWISINELDNYDIVPPSIKLFKKLGFLK